MNSFASSYSLACLVKIFGLQVLSALLLGQVSLLGLPGEDMPKIGAKGIQSEHGGQIPECWNSCRQHLQRTHW